MRKVLFKGDPLTLVGRNLKVNESVPDFKVVSGDLKEVGLSDYQGKIKIVTTFPSIDTPVCDLQVKEFNQRAAGLSEEVIVLAISKDLPFAQKRFCELNKISQVSLFSDYKFSALGVNYGLLIKELNLLARAVLIVDKNDILRYVQIVDELTSAPDYDDALGSLEEVLKNPGLESERPSFKCLPCEGGALLLAKEKVEKLMAEHSGWELVDDKKLKKEFKFKDSIEAKYFLDLISNIAESQDHHPIMTINYNKLKVILTTQAAGGLTDNDFIMVGIIDQIEGV